MKIAISYKDGQIFEHFGHAEVFAIYEYNEDKPEEMTKMLLECGDRHGHKAMADLMKDKTCFIIAHRLSTVQNADTILVVKDGRIIEQGTHEALLAKGGFYHALYHSQFH